jgi:ADP-heptose:LPS heptosyltransferase
MNVRLQRKLDNYIGRIGIAALRPAAMFLGLVLRRDHTLTVEDEIVWVKMLGGGSLLLAMPMLLGLRRAHPGVKMVLITTPGVAPFAKLMGVFDEYRFIDDRGALRLLWSAMRVLMRTLRADCIVDLEVHSRLTTVFTTLTLARNRVSFWLEDIFWRRGLASHLVFFNRASGSYHFYDRIGELLGGVTAARDDCRTGLRQSCQISDAVRPVRGRVSVGFACSDLGRERMLTPAQWVDVFRANLRPEHRTFAFLGGPGDKARGQEIIDALHTEFGELELRNCCGELTLPQSIQALFESTEFWGIDSSLLHIARIIGLRCVSYWGPTDPATRLRESWDVDETTHYRKIACSPCVHTSEEPPCHGDNRCIQGLFGEPGAAAVGWTPIEYPAHRRSQSPS